MKIFFTAEFHKPIIEQLSELFQIEYGGWFLEERNLDEEELIHAIKDKEIFVTSYDKVTRRVIEAGNKLKLIACTRANPVNIDIEAAREMGIKVVYTPGRNATTTAEFTIAMMLSIGRRIPMMHYDLKNGKFTSKEKVQNEKVEGLKEDVTWALGSNSTYVKYKGTQLSGKNLGLIGYGNIGEKVGNIAKAMGMKLLIYDPYIKIEDLDKEDEKKCSLEDLLQKADFVSCHCSVNKNTRKLMNMDRFKLMKRTAYFINTSRGAIVDEESLIEALRKNIIAGAAIDVFESEPIYENHPFLKELDNIVVTGHIGGATWDVIENHSEMIASDLIRFINSEPLMYEYK